MYSLDAKVLHTDLGTPYLQDPGVACLAATSLYANCMDGFLAGFDCDFRGYNRQKDRGYVQDCDLLAKIAGQVCYLSLGSGGTPHSRTGDYLIHIKKSGHGSVLEHANVTFLLYGISRSLTHELVRHRAGFAYSQVSQRYCGGKTLRFVERPEFQNVQHLHDAFLETIDSAAAQYERLTETLATLQAEGVEQLSGDSGTELRKKVRGAARYCLPNCTEAPIVVTANLRAWRNFLDQRATAAAELEIRRLAHYICQILQQIAPFTFGDYEDYKLPDGTWALKSSYRKV